MKIKVVLAEDHQMVREGLRLLLDAQPDIRVVGETADGGQVADVARQAGADIVVMDITMPHVNGVEATRRLKALCPDLKVIALSGHATRHHVVSMLEAGAMGFVVKGAAAQELVEAIRAVHRGQAFLSPQVAGKVVSHYQNVAQDDTPEPLRLREQEVLRLLAKGLSSKQIAAQLKIATRTAETHRRNITKKLKIHSIAELTKYAIREGLTSLDE